MKLTKIRILSSLILSLISPTVFAFEPEPLTLILQRPTRLDRHFAFKRGIELPPFFYEFATRSEAKDLVQIQLRQATYVENAFPQMYENQPVDLAILGRHSDNEVNLLMQRLLEHFAKRA